MIKWFRTSRLSTNQTLNPKPYTPNQPPTPQRKRPHQLSPPLGLKGKLVTRNALMQVIKDLQIPIRSSKITYHETFLAFVRRCLTGDVNDDDEILVEENDDEDIPAGGGGAPGAEKFRGRRITAAEDFAARAVQKAYRDWREQKIQVHKGTAWTTKLPLHGVMLRGLAEGDSSSGCLNL